MGATTTLDASGDSTCGLLYFDLSGSSYFEIRHGAPSSGNCDLRWWTVGPRSGK